MSTSNEETLGITIESKNIYLPDTKIEVNGFSVVTRGGYASFTFPSKHIVLVICISAAILLVIAILFIIKWLVF